MAWKYFDGTHNDKDKSLYIKEDGIQKGSGGPQKNLMLSERGVSLSMGTRGPIGEQWSFRAPCACFSYFPTVQVPSELRAFPGVRSIGPALSNSLGDLLQT